jgi:hypothetical protein
MKTCFVLLAASVSLAAETCPPGSPSAKPWVHDVKAKSDLIPQPD